MVKQISVHSFSNVIILSFSLISIFRRHKSKLMNLLLLFRNNDESHDIKEKLFIFFRVRMDYLENWMRHKRLLKKPINLIVERFNSSKSIRCVAEQMKSIESHFTGISTRTISINFPFPFNFFFLLFFPFRLVQWFFDMLTDFGIDFFYFFIFCSLLSLTWN